MRRVLAAFAALFALALSITPASADDEATVRARLAAVADQAAQNRQQIDRLQGQITDREGRITAERGQLKGLAKAIYVQPDNALVVIAQSPDLSDALSRVTDLLVAAGRARATKRALDDDLSRLNSEQNQLRTRQADLEGQQKELENEYAQLAALAAVAAPEQSAPPPPPSGSIPDLIRQAWASLGPARQDWAVRLANCESTLNPMAVNRSSGAAGLFQFMPSTWSSTPWHAQSPFDAVANSAAAAWLFQRYGAGQWSCSSRIQ
jgi:hypothetical protein